MRRVIFLFVIFSAVSVCSANIITVDDDGPADFNRIKDAIGTAGYGDTIQVASGVYVENITLKNGVAVIGAGADDTIINGNSNGSVVISSNCDANTVLKDFTITNGDITFNGNGFVQGGGMYNYDNSSPTVKNCIFTGNGGGGMVNGDSKPVVINCIFSNNTAFFYGGGMLDANSSPEVINCTFSCNSATIGGGMYNWLNSNPTLINCTFTGNSAWMCGGMYNWINSNPKLTNCTFTGNTAEIIAGGLCNDDSNTIVTNSIFWCNTAQNSPQIYNGAGSLRVTYSDVQGGWPGEGNIDTVPCFADTGYWNQNGTPADANDDFWVDGDYHLQSQAGRWDPNTKSWVIDANTSPCIDGGDWATPVGFEPFPNGGRINMGAYGGTAEASKSYFGKEPCKTIIAGDINGDCKVDFTDFAILAIHWQEEH
jgi:parallel beta-helix repeat protein